MSEHQPIWKDMAAASAMKAAVRANLMFRLLDAAKALLETIPDHWHDGATTEMRDAVAEAEKLYPRSPTP